MTHGALKKFFDQSNALHNVNAPPPNTICNQLASTIMYMVDN